MKNTNSFLGRSFDGAALRTFIAVAALASLAGWDGKELKPTFELDFTALKLGRPHHMLFGSTKIGS